MTTEVITGAVLELQVMHADGDREQANREYAQLLANVIRMIAAGGADPQALAAASVVGLGEQTNRDAISAMAPATPLIV